MIDTIDHSYDTLPMAMGKRKRDRQPAMWVATLQERIDAQMSAQRFGAVVLSALGVMAVLLTILGA